MTLKLLLNNSKKQCAWTCVIRIFRNSEIRKNQPLFSTRSSVQEMKNHVFGFFQTQNKVEASTKNDLHTRNAMSTK